MIAEAPAWSCTRKAKLYRRRQMARARQAVRICRCARVTGVAFFDFKHGQTGVAPNAIELLVLWRVDSRFTKPDDHVLTTATGRKHNPSNLRRDVLRTAVEAANAELAKAGIAEINGVTFHSLRRTYASLRCASGDDVRYTAEQIGHEDPRFTLRAYAQATRRRERLSGPHLRAYDRAIEWARMGTIEADESMPVTSEATKNPA